MAASLSTVISKAPPTRGPCAAGSGTARGGSPGSKVFARRNSARAPAARLLFLLCIAALSCCVVCQQQADHSGHGAQSAAMAPSGAAASVGTNQTSQNGTRPEPLPLPKDAESSCGSAMFHEFTFLYHTCASAMLHGGNPDELCCKGLSEYFGMNSTRPSRNCMCVPAVMKRLNEKQTYHRIKFSSMFQYCRVKYKLVVPFYQKGKGYCNGTQDDPVKLKDVDAEFVSILPTPKFSDWVSRLHDDWLMLTSFIVSIVSVPGFLAFLWPFVFDFGFTAAKTIDGLRSKQL